MEKFFSSIFNTSAQSDVELSNFLIILIGSLAVGIIIGAFYILTHKNETYTPSFPATMIMLPVVVAVIIRLVGTNAASALSLAGAFSLVRFRTAPADPKDIAYVFFALASGLACGIGYIGYAFVFTFFLCIVTLIIKLTRFGVGNENSMNLRISVPENLNFENLFEETLEKYTTEYKLMQVRTGDYGAVFEVKYAIQLKKDADKKAFLDEIRCKNGNLNIIMTKKEFEIRVS